MDEYAYVVNVDAAVVRGDEYVVVERSGGETHAAGELAFPGGKVEPDVDANPIEATARREVREEVGVDVGDVAYVCSNAFVADDGTQCLNVVTRCEYESGDPTVREPGEVADAFWLSHDALLDHRDVPPYVAAYAEQVAASREHRQ
jgi:8-oxo-dGTP diphosphatase